MTWLRRLRHSPLPLAPLLGVALLLRLGVCLGYVASGPPALVPLTGATLDLAGTDGYLQIAHTLLDHGVFGFGPELPAHHRPPLTPLLMTLAVWAPAWWLPWFALTCAMGVATVWVGARLARALSLSTLRRNALLLALALHPYFLLPARTNTFLPMAILGVLLLLWAYASFAQKPSWRMALALAGALAACLLTHASLLVIAPLALVALFVRSAQARRYSLIAAAATALLIAPWTLRNAATFHRFIPIADGAGYQYWKGEEAAFAHRDAGERAYLAATGSALPVIHWGTATPEQDARLWQLGLAHLAADPLHFAHRLLIGAGMFWAPWDGGPLKAGVCALLNLPLLALALRGWRRPGPHSPLEWLCLLAVLALWATFAFFAANTTYFPLALPMLIVLALRNLD